MTTEQELKMFGCEYKEFEESVLTSPDAKCFGLGFVLLNMMSDVQEMIERDLREEARQSLNRMKRLIREQKIALDDIFFNEFFNE